MGTLKTTDLPVGSWIRYKGKVYIVASVIISTRDYTPRVALMDQYYSCFGHVLFDDLEPIHITPEILEANGIHRTYRDDKYAIFRGDGLWAIEYSDGDWELSIPPVCRIYIKYVHQLQQALRLAGIDKEIVMPNK